MNHEDLDALLSIPASTRQDAERILFALESMPDGCSVNTCCLATEILDRPEDADAWDMFGLDRAIRLLAETHGLRINDNRHSSRAENLPFNLDFCVWHRANADENSKFSAGANPSERDYRYAYEDMVANAIGEILARALPANLVPTALSFDSCEVPACDAMLLTVSCEFEICGFGFELGMELDTGEGRLRCVDDPEPEPFVTSATLTCEGHSDDGDFLAYIWDTDTPEWRTNPDAEE